MSANTVGEKNMASSSGCAIKRHIRLLYNRGKLRANGEDEVEEKPQKMKMAETARPKAKMSAEEGIFDVFPSFLLWGD